MRHLKTAIVLAGVMSLASPALSQTRPRDPEDTVVKDVVVVAPTEGPVWWKVSNGESVVWIIGLPNGGLVQGTKWDTSAFKRRIKGAKVFLGTPRGMARFPEPTDVLDTPRRARVAATASKLGYNPVAYSPASFSSVLQIRGRFFRKLRMSLDVEAQMASMAKSAGVKVDRRQYPTVFLYGEDLALSDPSLLTCIDAMLDELNTPPEAFKANAEDWAQGRALAFLAGPRGAATVCDNRLVQGASFRAIANQTADIAEALQSPGKAVAAAPIRLLVAEDGIIQRLKAQGFTISDPTKPLMD